MPASLLLLFNLFFDRSERRPRPHLLETEGPDEAELDDLVPLVKDGVDGGVNEKSVREQSMGGTDVGNALEDII